jgi:hypothetical protein
LIYRFDGLLCRVDLHLQLTYHRLHLVGNGCHRDRLKIIGRINNGLLFCAKLFAGKRVRIGLITNEVIDGAGTLVERVDDIEYWLHGV